MRTIGHVIAGKELVEEAGRFADVLDPAAGRVSARVALASPAMVDQAVGAAADAFRSWRHSSLTQRAEILFRFRELVDAGRERLAEAIVTEHGKVMDDALGEVARGLQVVEFACGAPYLLKGGHSENVSRSVDAYDLRQPVGVCVGVTPFNFPAMVPMWLFPVAIACGNTFVLKPSEKVPSAAGIFAELLARAGLPEGVFNVVHGDKLAVERLLEHPDVAAISSVGSTPVARRIYEAAARHGKRVQALGGAKNHMVVLPDADIGAAAAAAVSAAYGSAGERCMAISAVVAVGDAADPLVDAIAAHAAQIVVGPGDQPGSQMGPLITGEHRDRVRSYIDAGVAAGAQLVLDGRDVAVDAGGFFLGPCLFDRVTRDMTIYTDEIFGPVLCVLRADSLEGAIELVNDNPYGNGVALFTRDGGAARRFQHEVEVGMVGINVPIPVPMSFYSFGGWKSSLFGDTHVHGAEGIRFYSRIKAVTARWPNAAPAQVALSFPS